MKKGLLNSKQKWWCGRAGLNETANARNGPHEIILIISCYEDIIKTQNKKVTGYILKQGHLFEKFKDTEKMLDKVNQQSFSKFAYNIFRKKHTELNVSTLFSNYFKINF